MDSVRLGGLALDVEELGPGESPFDCIWRLDPRTVFAGDVAYNGMHAYLADGHWEQWLDTLDRLDATLPADVTLHVGHGPSGGKELLDAQRRYIETFIAALTRHADAVAAGDHTPVMTEMNRLLATDDLLFLMELSIEPVLAAIRAERRRMSHRTMVVPLPSPDETLLTPPDAVEATRTARGIAFAAAPTGGLTELQRILLEALYPAMTGHQVDLRTIEPVSPRDFAELLRHRDLQFRTRGVQVMLLCALVLRPLPEERGRPHRRIRRRARRRRRDDHRRS